MSRTKSGSMDMLQGPMLGKMLIFALPLAAGSILQQLFNAVDVAVVGQFASSEALAAVGANSSVVNLLVNLFVGVSVGSNVVIANLIGKGQKNRVGSAVHTSIAIAFLGGLILMALGLVVARPLLTLMSTPEDVIEMAIVYLRLYCLGMPFIMLYNFGAAILRSVGDTKRPLYCLIVSGIINAGLNMFFVIVLKMSVSGVAIATVISNVISAIMILNYLKKADELVRLDIRKLRIQKDELVQILKIGVPAGIQGVVFCLANVCIQASINGFGAAAVAGSAISINFESFSYYMVNGFNAAVMTFVSQNYGAANMQRCKRAILLGMLSALVADSILICCFVLLRNPIIGIFTADPQVAAYAAERMISIVALHFLVCSYEIAGSAMRGLGRSLVPAMLTIFGTCALRIIYINTYTLTHTSFRDLLMVYPISWCVTGTMVIVALLVVWRKKV